MAAFDDVAWRRLNILLSVAVESQGTTGVFAARAGRRSSIGHYRSLVVIISRVARVTCDWELIQHPSFIYDSCAAAGRLIKVRVQCVQLSAHNHHAAH